jgi:uncharacterized caspase-like protein
VIVATQSVEEIEANLASAALNESRQTNRRYWTDQEIEDAVLANDDPTVHELFRFANEEGVKGRIQSSGPKASAAFGFYMAIPRADGRVGAKQVFTWVETRRKLIVYTNWETAALPTDVLETYKNDLRAVFGAVIDKPEPNIPIAEVGENLEAFEAAIRRLQVAVRPIGAG